MSSRTRTVFVAAPIAITLLLTACSGGSSNSGTLTVTAKDAAAATRTAGPASTTGTALGPAGAKGPVQGVVDGDLSGTGVVKAAMFSGALRNDVEIRWKNKTLYVNRAEVADPRARATAGIGAWMLRAPIQRPWATRPVGSQFTPELFAAFAPAALADLLVTHKIEVDVTRDGSQRKLHATKPLPIVTAWLNATVDLWIDGGNRITHVQVSSKTGGMSYDVKYGGSEPAFVAPPPGSIDHLPPSTPKPTGPFVTVRSGNDDGVAWSLQRAPATRGYECWRWQSTPPVKIVDVDGEGNRCIPVADPTDDPADQTRFVASSDGKGKHDVLAIRLPADAREVGVSPIGGQPSTKPASGGVFVWVGPIAAKAGFAFVSLADGSRLSCGPGWISLPTDWSTVDPADKARLMASPWVCT